MRRRCPPSAPTGRQRGLFALSLKNRLGAGRASLGGLLVAITVPGVAWAATAGGHPRFGPILFGLAVLVVAAKAGGLHPADFGLRVP